MAKSKKTVKAEPAPRGESGLYPYHSLQQSLKFGEVVAQVGGTDVPKSLIAQQLGTSDSSSTFYQSVASAKAYGIVEGTRDMSLTLAGQDYFQPISESSRRSAELKFFASPRAFQFLIDRFDGKVVPGSELLANLLVRYDQAPTSWAVRVASFFTVTANSLGLIDGRGFLRFDATMHKLRAEPSTIESDEATPSAWIDPSKEDAPSLLISGPNARMIAAPTHMIPGTESMAATGNVWVYTESGGTVRLETPDPLPLALWERLTKYVEVLRPSGGDGSK